uniref:ESF1-like protein n=1 Tax=Panagrolaimus sp. ES5 TaxID=591445 RepID=A0AC34G5X1_9BILA
MCSSDDDSESGTDSEVERENDQNEVIWDQLQTGIRHVEWASKRLAICNMDWDHVKGEDLLLLLQSFKPASGEVKAVAIYLSDFGAERLEAEEKEGPKMEIKKVNPDKKVVDGQDIDEETRSAIRIYQFDRMRYYYAVVECDTVETATSIYEACDRVEYESSGVQLDLRFIPDVTIFEESRLRERVTIDNINVNKYKANYFETAAIRFQNPKVTWDETNPDRLKKFDRIMKKENPDEVSDLEDLIAPGSDDEASDDEHGGGKDGLKELLAAAGIKRNEKPSMLVDWEP